MYNFPEHRFADVFDDVIGNALAGSGVVGDEIDGAGARGAVDVQLFIFR